MPTPVSIHTFGSLLAGALLSVCSQAYAFDDIENLQGKVIVYAGKFESLDCPIGGKYDCLKWPELLLRTRRGAERCFATSRVQCGFSCSGMIAVDQSKDLKLYVIDRVGSSVTEADIEPVRCPNMY